MTATAERPAARQAKKKSAPAPTFVPTAPQVNLLPPEVRAARSLSVVKRWLGISLVAVLAVVVLGFAGAVLARSNADAELASAEGTQADLRTEEAQYAEVPRVLGAIQLTTEARTAGMATEISWKRYMDAISSVLPVGMSIDDFTFTGPSPLAPSVVSTDPLQGASIGTVSMNLRSSTAPVTSDLLDSLARLPGIAGPWVSSVSASEDEGTVYYAVTVSAQLTEDALAERFAAVEGGE